ncbi:transcription factor HES-3-like [Sinocyclocheilus grahami]|uniref:transcription factor HES-3-like n=1 Tax=Sinocyclocheilus grahami TaxID=75366 RepID=UPI0007AC9929|nr:PREDICTED: transcription factor HES-3-like [Sinocyclocheilus grahami]
MAAASDRVVTAKTQSVKKVSKPLMEKKRRARINKCLNQLKSLLEGVCSNNIRKRKLEKADILELTVKHLMHLQNTKRGIPTVCDSAEYHAGYRSCLATVSHYLLASDADRDSRSIMLTHLTSGPNHARAPDFSTAESDPARIPAPTCTLRRSHKASFKTDAPYPNLQQTSDSSYCSMPKRIDICDMDKISFNAQAGAHGSKKLKTTHFSLKNSKVDECCNFSEALKQNYWRPW